MKRPGDWYTSIEDMIRKRRIARGKKIAAGAAAAIVAGVAWAAVKIRAHMRRKS